MNQEAIIEALGSVLSEEGIREYLCSYVMGVELIERFDAFKSPSKTGDWVCAWDEGMR